MANNQVSITHFFGGKPPPSKKRSLNEEERVEEKKARDKRYDKDQRQRKPVKEWFVKYPWLTTEEKNGDTYLFCKVCKENEHGDPSSNFVKSGCNNIRLEAIKRHADSKGHKKCEAVQAAALTPIGESLAEKTLQKITQANFQRLQLSFNTYHTLAKHNRPFTDFLWQCALDDKKKVDIGISYRSDKEAHTFVHYIAEVERMNLVSDLKKAKFFSVICDGSTDSSITEQEIVYVQFAIGGDLNTRFIACAAPGKANAVNIHNSVVTAVCEQADMTESVFYSKVVGLGSDGASVMQGKRGGVIALLKEKQPAVVGVHCMAHRLELAFKTAVKSDKQVGKMEQLLMNLYVFYHKSPLNRSMLKRSFAASDTNELIPTRIGGTRWVPHIQRAIDHVIQGYGPLVQHLLEVTAVLIHI